MIPKAKFLIKPDLLTQSFIFLGTSWVSVGIFNHGQSISISERIVQLKMLSISNVLKFITSNFLKSVTWYRNSYQITKFFFSLFFCYQIQLSISDWSSIDCEHRKSDMRAKEVRAIKARVKKAKAKSKHRVTSKRISGFIKQDKVETNDHILKNRNSSKEWERSTFLFVAKRSFLDSSFKIKIYS